MTTDTKTLTVKKSFAASPDRVFHAWIDPNIAQRFLFATPTGEIIRCDIDARPGGKFFITRRDEQGDTEHVGEYEVVDRPKKLMFTFGVPRFTSARTRVTLDFVPNGTGCVVTLTHEGVWPDWVDKTIEGWTMILDNETKALA